MRKNKMRKPFLVSSTEKREPKLLSVLPNK